MIKTSVALKSNLDVEIEAPTAAWSSLLFPPGSNSPTKRVLDLPPEPNISRDEQLPSHVAQAISGLQRDVLLLRNELNFELWLSRENVKHIGRLYQDRILSKNAEVEQQGLVSFFSISTRTTKYADHLIVQQATSVQSRGSAARSPAEGAQGTIFVRKN
jgi:hypothetical protein